MAEKRMPPFDKTKAKTISMQAQSAQTQDLASMVNGFSHEMQNALLGPNLLLDQLLGLDTQSPNPISKNEQNIQSLKIVHDTFEDQLYEEAYEDALLALKSMYDNFEESEKRLKSLHVSIKRATEITRLILEYSRIGRKPTEKVQVALPKLVRDAVSDHQGDWEQHAIQVQLDLKEDMSLWGHPVHFYRIVNELLLNAKEALIPQDTSALPQESKLSITDYSSKHHYHIVFWDTGIGIEQDDLDQIFEPFFSTKRSCTGLGLAIVKKILLLYQGEIIVTSQVGKGSSFAIELPLL